MGPFWVRITLRHVIKMGPNLWELSRSFDDCWFRVYSPLKEIEHGFGYTIIRSPYTPYSIYLRETIAFRVEGSRLGLKAAEFEPPTKLRNLEA